MGELGASCLTPWVAPPYHQTGTHNATPVRTRPGTCASKHHDGSRIQRYSAKSTTVASAAGVNLNSLHLGPSPRPLTVAGRFMQRSGFLPVEVRLIHPYPTPANRRDAVLG